MSESKHDVQLAAPPSGESAGRGRAGRLALANEIIRIVGSHGRRFLSMSSDRRVPLPESEDRFSRFEFQGGRLWYVDKWREARIFVHYDPIARSGWGRHFSDGGTLLSLCRALRNFILTGEEHFLRHLGPFREWRCGGDPWGYGGDMAVVREKIATLLGPAHAPAGAGASEEEK